MFDVKSTFIDHLTYKIKKSPFPSGYLCLNTWTMRQFSFILKIRLPIRTYDSNS